MADKAGAKRAAKPAKTKAKTKAKPKATGFTADERAAMRDRAKELKAAKSGKAAEEEVLAKIAEMPAPQRKMATKVHAIVKKADPSLAPKTWYGMPAYAKDGSIVCFFQSAHRFKVRYSTLGFSDKANLDNGAMWPTTYALDKLDEKVEKKIAALVKQAVRDRPR
jgi:hypothetical protein